MQEVWNFEAKHDWASSPMNASVAWTLFACDLWTWSKYYTERSVVKHTNKKFTAHKTDRVVLVHAFAGVIETVLGLIYILNPNGGYEHIAKACAWVALLLHIPTGLYLAPKVWGIPHITVTGYVFVGLCRAVEACMVLFHEGGNVKLLPRLWILLVSLTSK